VSKTRAAVPPAQPEGRLLDVHVTVNGEEYVLVLESPPPEQQ
jgi:hypothetical protein